jgi:hypothetical protein
MEDTMAWEYPVHTCGHKSERLQMYGPMDGRRRRLEAIESHPCPDCRKNEADQKAKEAGLPALNGSPKQITWASEIRERALRLLPTDRAEQLKPETSAKWWIENRGGLNA